MPDISLFAVTPAPLAKDDWKVVASSDVYAVEEEIIDEKEAILEDWLSNPPISPNSITLLTCTTAEENNLISPRALQDKIPMLKSSLTTITESRARVDAVLDGSSDKLIVVVGPCSIHDTHAALEYAQLLLKLSKHPKISSNLVVVMRAYFEKPRTTVGWKGLLNDPDLDGGFKMDKGLHIGRQLFSDLTSIGMPIASELLGVLTPRYLTEYLSLGAIGARTTESQVHREIASGMPFPIGFKNGTDGGFTVAIDALESSLSKHAFVGISNSGHAAIIETEGNKNPFIILRGGGGKTNYDSLSVAEAKETLRKRSKKDIVMVDCSHGNSSKNHNNQPIVASDIANQIRAGERGIIGVMIESNINAGAQSLPALGRHNLKRGVSITDACIDWQTTVDTLMELAEAVQERRLL